MKVVSLNFTEHQPQARTENIHISAENFIVVSYRGHNCVIVVLGQRLFILNEMKVGSKV